MDFLPAFFCSRSCQVQASITLPSALLSSSLYRLLQARFHQQLTGLLWVFVHGREAADKAAWQERLQQACDGGLGPFREALAEWRSTEKDGVECPSWVPQLRSLVQAGVPRVRPSRG